MPQFSCPLGDEKCADTLDQLDAVFLDFVDAYNRLHEECLRYMQHLDVTRFRREPGYDDPLGQRPEGNEQKVSSGAVFDLKIDFKNHIAGVESAGDPQFPPQRPEGREESELATFFQEPVSEMHVKGLSQTHQTLPPSPIPLSSPTSNSGADGKLSPSINAAPRQKYGSWLKSDVRRSTTGLSGIGETSGHSVTSSHATANTVPSRTGAGLQHPMLQRGRSAQMSQRLQAESTRASKSRTMTRLITAAESSSNPPNSWLFSTKRNSWSRTYFQVRDWYKGSPREAAITLMDPIMGIFIALDCILTGISMDTEDWAGWYTIDVCFAGIFSIEMILKLKLIGFRKMFCGSLWAWSLFDTLIVVLAILDLFAQFSGSVTVIRVVRLFRLARLVRLVRVPALKELVMLIRGMVGGTRCLFWCLFSLTLPIFIVGMLLSQFLKEWGEDRLFATVPSAMFTTMRCMCGDCSDEHGRPLIMQLARDRGWHYALFYAVFILVTIFGVFNLITAIFLEVTMLAAKSDTNLQRQVRKANNRKFARNIKRLAFLFWEAHAYKVIGGTPQGDGTNRRLDARDIERFNIEDALDLQITQEFYDEVVAVPIVRDLLDDMGLADDDMVDLFEMLDVTQSGTLSLIDLVSGMNRLRGDATKKDLVALAYMIFSLQEGLSKNNLGTSPPSARITEDTLGEATDSNLPSFFAGLSKYSIRSG